ncbi:MAG TPA: APC family permease [Armatimonadota bacterium]|jgi:amino acid transporter
MPLELKRVLIGKPLPTSRATHERLNNVQALAVFASDAVSSTAYATQEILLVLTTAGAAALGLSIPIALAITVLLAVITLSYQQTIFAYPTGGGAYLVCKDNLGPKIAQVAGAALLLDYILTVAVSVSAGVAALTSAYPVLHGHTVLICLAAILIIALGNIRGVRESGTVFAIPTYFFIVMACSLLLSGFYRYFTGHEPVVPHHSLVATESIGFFLILRAFASGCAALTGIEAISDGIQAFRPPESRNASKTMIAMSLLLGFIFLGITWLSHHYGISYREHDPQTVPSMLASAIFGRGFLYLAFQISTMGILFMGANTSYADFPRLCSFEARDGYLPRQLTNLGERLVFNNGILMLSLLASALLITFHGSTDRLIPLYAVGVFISFTLSQTGMVMRWRKMRTPGWRLKATINGLGATTTAIVCLIIGYTKFTHGAWIVVMLIPILVTVFLRINLHYQNVARQLRFDPALPKLRERAHNKVLVLVPSLNKGSLPAVEFAHTLSGTAVGFHIDTGRDPVLEERLHELWEKICPDMPLIIVHSPYREVVRPILQYIDEMKASGGGPVTVVLPEFVPRRFWHSILHNQTGLMIKWALLFKRDVVLCNYRYYLEQ